MIEVGSAKNLNVGAGQIFPFYSFISGKCPFAQYENLLQKVVLNNILNFDNEFQATMKKLVNVTSKSFRRVLGKTEVT